MNILRFDSVGGASGDMILACLIGLGADVKAIIRQLATIRIDAFRIQKKSFTDHGMSGIQVKVVVPHSRHHEHRSLSDIKRLISRGKLSQRVKAMSIKVFERLGKVEAAVHRTPVENIHFHEIGAMDSIVDIVGSCVALELLGIEGAQVGPLPMGCGMITSEHGIMPNPAPATVELLKGFPVVQTDEPVELVTPTAAALFATWGTGVMMNGEWLIVNEANAFGHRTLNSRPNLLRAMILKQDHQPSTTSNQPSCDSCLVLETEIDDANPQLLGALSGKLLHNGALDVFTTAIQMKKQRQGTLLTALCHPEKRDLLIDLIFCETTTFGIREYMTNRTILNRRYVEVKTPYGKVRVKVGTWKGRDITFSPEFDDCVRCAKKNDVSVRAVYAAAVRKT